MIENHDFRSEKELFTQEQISVFKGNNLQRGEIQKNHKSDYQQINKCQTKVPGAFE